uniref:PyrJ4 n=1 Tax=Streptomyces rugosporus TaxID=295838 RepID=K7R6H6_STRRG|nr:PyrJ4 [Streptomyces rugosporus]
MTYLDAVRSEWVKFRTLRSSTYTMLVTLVLGVGMAVLFASGKGRGFRRLDAAAQAAFDPTEAGLTGAVLLAQVAMGTLGVLAITSEYGTGMIGASLSVVPRRGRVFGAKALLITLISLVVGEVVSLASFLASQMILSDMDVPSASLGDPGVLVAVTGTGGYLALVGLLGTAVGTLIRSTAGAVVVMVLVTVIFPYFFSPLLPPAVQMFWPTMAGMAVLSTSLGAEVPPYGPLAIMAAGVAVATVAGYFTFRTRDVSA